jgi:hypothetical protein
MAIMMTASKKYRISQILWSLVWAFALVATAFLFKGNPAIYWIESAILVGAIFCLMWNYERSASRR